MAYDGAGNFARVMNWQADKLAAIKITAVRHDLEDDNFATAFNQVVLRNGVAPFTGDIKAGGNLLTGLGAGTAAIPSVHFTADVSTGIYMPAAGELGISAGGVERAHANNTGFNIPAGQLLGVGTNTPRTQLDVVGVSSVRTIFEDTTYSTTGITGAVNLDVITSVVTIFDANAAGNFSFNIRGDGANSLNSIMAIGQTMSLVVEVPQGATPYYCTAINIDGSAPFQIKWFNGGAPVAGNASGIDTYTITVFKQAANKFYVRAALAQVK